MRTIITILVTLLVFSANAQYTQPTRTISVEDLNKQAERLTQQCVYLHIAEIGSVGLGIILFAAAIPPDFATNPNAQPNPGLVTVGTLCLIAAPVFGIIEWIKVAHAHSILTLGNPKLSISNGKYGLGLAYNF